jgi:4-hydroxy-3-methylbut-2-enyl diphosphate reductase
MIGHAGHPEVEGTMGQADDGIHSSRRRPGRALAIPRSSRLAYVTQTTLSVVDCQEVSRAAPALPARRAKKQDICYATQNRQDAVKFMAPQCDLVLVIGSPAARTATASRWSPRRWARRRG